MNTSIVFDGEIDERSISRSVDKVDKELQQAGNIDVDADASGMDMGGIGGGGSGGDPIGEMNDGIGGMQSQLSDSLPGSIPAKGGVATKALPIAIAGGVGVGMLSAMQGASASMQASQNMLGMAWNNVWRPIGDDLDDLLIRDAVENVAEATAEFEQTWRDGERFDAMVNLIGDLSPDGGGIGRGINEALNIPDGNEVGQRLNEWANIPDGGDIGERLNGWLNIPDGGDMGRKLNDWLSIPDGNEVGKRIRGWFQDFSWPSLPEFSWPDLASRWPGWSSFVPDTEWGEFIPEADWDAYVPSLSWSEWVDSVSWSDYVSDMSWFSFVSRINWWSWIPSIDWDSWVPDLNWRGWVPELSWGDWIPTIDWGEHLPSVSADPRDWRRGGVLTTPTMVGPGQRAGEAGPEVIAPFAEIRRMFEGMARREQSGGNVDVDLSSLERKMDTLIREIRRQETTATVRIGEREFAELVQDSTQRQTAARDPLQ